MKHVLVLTDFSEPSRIAVGHAVELGAAVGAELLLLHVVDVSLLDPVPLAGIRAAFAPAVDPTGKGFRPLVPHAASNGLYAEAEQKLTALLPPLDSARLRTRGVVGRVANEILRVAVEERINLIIMGIQGEKGWRCVHLYSVSERVIHSSAMPVMTLWLPRHAFNDPKRAHP